MSEEKLSLDTAADKKEVTTENYHAPGIYDNDTIVDIKHIESQNGKLPYIVMRTKCPDGLGRSRKMYYTAKAWPITARQFVELIQATTGQSEESAKNSIKDAGVNELVANLSSIVVGKEFRGVYHGRRSKKDGKERIYAELMYVESMKVPRGSTKLYFDPAKHIKDEEVYTTNTSSPEAAKVNTVEIDNLPF